MPHTDELNPSPRDDAPETEPADEVHRKYLRIASHDIRGSLANARASASFLLDSRHGLDEKARRWAEMSVRNADKALLQLRHFFEWAQYQTGHAEPVIEMQPILEILKGAAAEAEKKAFENGAVFTTAIDPSLPDAPVDRELLGQSTHALLEYGLSQALQGDELFFRATLSGDALLVTLRGGSLDRDRSVWGMDPETRAVEEGKLGAGFQLALARCRIALMGGHAGIAGEAQQTTAYFKLPTLRPTDS